MSKQVNGRGRPEQYGAGFTRAFKAIVKKNGLLKGHALINAEGVTFGGYTYEVGISLPTLSKYVKKDTGGAVVELKRGRPRLAKAA